VNAPSESLLNSKWQSLYQHLCHDKKGASAPFRRTVKLHQRAIGIMDAMVCVAAHVRAL
jgi:hypothetical protein